MLQGFKEFILKGNVIDLAVAVVIAGLFLQSAWSIVRDALGDLRGAAHV